MMSTRWLLALAGIWLAVAAVLAMLGHTDLAGPALLVSGSSLALWLQCQRPLRTFAFTVWVMVFVAAAMIYPAAFRSWGSFELKRLMIPLIQLIMFGMGTTLSVKDFTRVFSMPRAVLIGMVLQFTVMPVAGALLAAAFGFEPAVAAGVVLVGSCPGGVASNVMTFLAKGNVALSVTMTACSTLVSPIMTPLMMRLLAGQYIEIDFLAMMVTIIQIVIVPIIAGLIANKILQVLGLRGRLAGSTPVGAGDGGHLLHHRYHYCLVARQAARCRAGIDCSRHPAQQHWLPLGLLGCPVGRPGRIGPSHRGHRGRAAERRHGFWTGRRMCSRTLTPPWPPRSSVPG